MMTPDVQKLKMIAQDSPVAKALFKLFSERERSRANTNIKRLRRILRETTNVNVKPSEIGKLFERLEQAGVGHVVYGRGNKPNRFIWAYSLKSVADSAMGKKAELQKQRTPKVKLPSIPGALPETAVSKIVEVSNGKVILRKGDIELELPSILTGEEQDNILTLIGKISVAS